MPHRRYAFLGLLSMLLDPAVLWRIADIMFFNVPWSDIMFFCTSPAMFKWRRSSHMLSEPSSAAAGASAGEFAADSAVAGASAGEFAATGEADEAVAESEGTAQAEECQAARTTVRREKRG